jgi:hypothetical protein
VNDDPNLLCAPYVFLVISVHKYLRDGAAIITVLLVLDHNPYQSLPAVTIPNGVWPLRGHLRAEGTQAWVGSGW